MRHELACLHKSSTLATGLLLAIALAIVAAASEPSLGMAFDPPEQEQRSDGTQQDEVENTSEANDHIVPTRPLAEPPAILPSSPPPAPEPDYSATLPTALEYQEGFHGTRIEFAPHGPYAFFWKRPDAANVWAEWVYFWPWWAGMLAGLFVLLALWRLRRIQRFPRPPGTTYCRRCNYCLRGIKGEQCPECGITLTRKQRLPGRPLWRRMIAPAVFTLPLLGHLAMLGFGVPREGAISHWWVWPSTQLYTLKEQYQFGKRGLFGSMTNRLKMRRVVQVDLRTGQIVAVPIFVPERWQTMETAFTPDGTQLVFAQHDEPAQLRVWDVDAMHTASVIDAPDLEFPKQSTSRGLRIEFTPTQDQIVTRDEEVVLRWNLNTGDVQKITDEAAWPMRFAAYEPTSPGSGLFEGRNESSLSAIGSKFGNHIVDRNGATVLQLHMKDRDTHDRGTFGPNGDQLFIYRAATRERSAPAHIEVHDLKTSDRQRLPWPHQPVPPEWHFEDGPDTRALRRPDELGARHINGRDWLIVRIRREKAEHFWAYDIENARWQPIARFTMEAQANWTRLTRNNYLWVLQADDSQPYQAKGYDLAKFLQ